LKIVFNKINQICFSICEFLSRQKSLNFRIPGFDFLFDNSNSIGILVFWNPEISADMEFKDLLDAEGLKKLFFYISEALLGSVAELIEHQTVMADTVRYGLSPQEECGLVWLQIRFHSHIYPESSPPARC
jgi:hypothetical protein